MTNKQALAVLHRMQRKLLYTTQALDNLELQESEMALDPTVATVISALDTATTAVATRIQTLIDKANNAGSLSAAEVVAALQPEVDRLNAMGADPANPIP